MAENPSQSLPPPTNAGIERGPAGDALAERLYDQLRALAQKHMNTERAGHTLSATALVNEAYIRLSGPRDVAWRTKGHFYAAAAEAMQRILLDHARARRRLKRGGGAKVLPLEAAAGIDGGVGTGNAGEETTDFIALDAALRRLEGRDPRMAQVVRLKFYAGLEISQVAEVLGVSERTVQNDWAFAKVWLEKELREGAGEKENGEPRAGRDRRGEQGGLKP